jgi:zinc protease
MPRACLVLCAALAGCAVARYEVELPERHAMLPSGMRVILLPDTSTGLVEVDVRYEVGAADDPEGRAGMAHLVQHLMFDIRPSAIDRRPLGALLEEHTLFLDASTDWDRTQYQALASAGELDALVRLEAARLVTGCRTLDDDALGRARETVRRELARRAERPRAGLAASLAADIFPAGHPYRREVGGDLEQLGRITLAEVCRFVADHYVPERAIMLIAGNVTEDHARAAVGQWLAHLPSRSAVPRRDLPELRPGRGRTARELDVDRPTLFLAWHLPPRFSREGYLVDLALRALEHQADVRSFRLGGPRQPVFVLEIPLPPGATIEGALAGMRDPGRGRLDAFDPHSRAALMADLAVRMESLPARTRSYADYAQFDASGGYVAGDVMRIEELTPAQIRRALDAALDPDRALVVVARPRPAGATRAVPPGTRSRRAPPAPKDEDDDEDDEREDLPVDRAQAGRALTLPERVLASDASKGFTLGNGLRVLLVPTPSPLPLVSAGLVFAAGEAQDPPGLPGLAALSARALEPDLAGQLAAATLGIPIARHVSSDATAFVAHGLARQLPELLAALEALARAGEYRLPAPAADPTAERGADRGGHSVADPAAARRAALERALRGALFGPSHPYAASLPSPESDARLGREAAYEFKEQHFRARNATLVVTGSFDAAAAGRWAQEMFASWSPGTPDPAPAAASVARSGPVHVDIAAGDDLPRARFALAYPAPAGLDDDYPGRLVLAEMLAQRAAALRDELGAAAGFHGYARHVAGLAGGYYEVGGEADAAAATRALAGLRQATEALRRGDGFLVDFVRARRTVLARLLLDGPGSAAMAARIERVATFHAGPGFDEALAHRLAALGPKDVVKLVNTELRPELEVSVVVGPPRAQTSSMVRWLAPTNRRRGTSCVGLPDTNRGTLVITAK